MTRDFVEKYYLKGDYNCAETLLLAANDAYGLGLPEGAHKLVSAFGGGMGCERTCGAVCGALAALGYLRAKGRAHATEGFRQLCAGFAAKVEQECGSIECSALMARYRTEETRCFGTVLRVADLLDVYLEETKQ
ncbi:MAG: C-GCAxxG-C-C family (seleno)protein [bacterium]|nr:C-GCAxxG-C-C family (seleno)protein [bacterium]